MAAAFLAGLLLASSSLVLTGLVICAEYRWVARAEYRHRVRTRNWDAYWPIVVPARITVDLY